MSDDIIHDVAYDYYGRRVATCSSDNTIRVFDEAGSKVAEWKAHSGTIWRLTWAHPEFGVVLASCSFDRKICIWEDTADAEDVTSPGEPVSRVAAWPRVAEIADARDSVVDVQFAPHHVGVRLASCGADGIVRIHEAPDVLDLGTWELHSQFEAIVPAPDAEGSSNPSLHGAGSLAVGSAAGSAGVNSGIGGGGAGVAGGSGGGDGAVDLRRNEPLCLAWCTSLVEAPMIVIGMGDGSAVLWKLDVRAPPHQCHPAVACPDSRACRVHV